MKALFGTLSLLLVLAIVGLLLVRQLRAPVLAGPLAPVASTNAALPNQARQLEQRVTGDITRAIEQGAAARRQADEP